MQRRTFGLVNNDGRPLDGRVAGVLARLRPRLQRQFPALDDDVVVTEFLEEAGRRITSRERTVGPIEKLYGFAWVTVRNIAVSRVRSGSVRVAQMEERSESLASMRAQEGTPERIERDILLREALERLSEEERLVCVWKKAGSSSDEIAQHLGRTVGSVDTLFTRAKQKLRDLLAASSAPSTRRQGSTPVNEQAPGSHTPTHDTAEAADGAARSPSGRR